jgi:hypothetical protein
MLTAYLDETGRESKDYVFIAGHVGNEDQWKKFAEKWSAARGKRNHIHLSSLRWANLRTKKLLAALGPIPSECGLVRVLGGVRVSDYADLIEGPRDKKALAGYYFALNGLVAQLIRWIPDNERVELVFENQDRYRDAAGRVMNDIAAMLVNSRGLRKLAKWSFVPKGSTMLLEQADYFANALGHLYRDEDSKKVQWTSSILGDMRGIVAISSRKQIRYVVRIGNAIKP